MPTTFEIPDYPIVVPAQPDKPIRISPGKGTVYVDGEKITEPVVVRSAAVLSGTGTVSTTEVSEPVRKPRKPRPSEIAKKAAKKAAPKKGKKK